MKIINDLDLHFSHLADAFIQSDLQMRTIEAIKTNKRATTRVSAGFLRSNLRL